MGSGIAAHLANAGVSAVLLDIVPPGLSDAEKGDDAARDRFAQGGLDRALKARPAAFFHPSNARLVEIGNTEDDLEKVAGCDLVIEAIIEKMEAKQALFERLERLVSPDCVVASNTSGLRIAEMLKGRGERFRQNFLVMHFFNPVRYMKLLELVRGDETSDETYGRVVALGEALGKGIVLGKDTPNFIGNRVGVYAMLGTIHQMLADGLTPEDVDAITGAPMAHPKSASFRTADMVGLDTLVHVADNCWDSLTADEEREVFKAPAFIRAMVDKRLLGDKTKGGFFKRVGKDVQTFDPATLAYRDKGGDPAIKAVTKELSKIEDPRVRVKKLCDDQGKAGAFGWKILAKTLAYAARRVPEIASSIDAVDDAMRWGYNWELGPFEVWDALGFAATVDRMKASGVALPPSIDAMKAKGATGFYRADGAVWDLVRAEYVPRAKDPRNVTLAEARRGGAPVLKNDGAEAWDLGDGVLGFTLKTKANSIDPDVIALLPQAVERAERDFRAMVLTNEGEHFCVGANLLLVMMAANQKDWAMLTKMVGDLQAGLQRVKYASVPVVAAPYGMTLGGGLELCLASTAVQAYSETYSGLVEVGVGLLPGGCGNVNLLWRALEAIPEGVEVDPLPFVVQTFKSIALAKVATSADEAKRFGYFRRSDGVSFDRARQLSEAKAHALGLAAAGYHAPVPRAFKLPGESGVATLSMMVDTLVAGGYASAHDAKIARKVAHVLCGGASGASRLVTEQDLLDLEREAFVSLCGEPKSLERMQHMLMNNKPLRN